MTNERQVDLGVVAGQGWEGLMPRDNDGDHLARPGILAIFNNVTPGRESEFEEWFQHEHLQERLAVPGFLLGRRYEAVRSKPSYFNFYVTRSADVLASAEYRTRLNDPTPMTRMVMSEIFKDMIRAVCRQSFRTGTTRGAFAVAARFAAPPDESALKAALQDLAPDRGIACGEIWSAAPEGKLGSSEEERLRGGDRTLAACLVVETLRMQDAERVAAVLSGQFPAAAVGVYRLLCEIRRGANVADPREERTP
jgi:hypothetical protein